MANHKSAKKRARQSETRKIQNKSYLSGVKSTIKSYQASLNDVSKGEAENSKAVSLFKIAQSALQKAATRGVLHRNTAARKVGRLALQLKKAQSSEVK